MRRNTNPDLLCHPFLSALMSAHILHNAQEGEELRR